MFAQGSFLQNANETPDQIKRKRALIQAMMPQYGKARYVGEGLGQLFQGIGSGMQERKLDKAETDGTNGANDIFSRVMAGVGGRSGGTSSFGGSPGGTWTPGAPPPKATDLPPGMGNEELGFGLPAAPKEGNGGLSFGNRGMTPQEMIVAGAEARGLDPIDVATAISYETGGTFDPTKGGPTTQWGQHRGLIQFGEPQAAQYGVDFSNPDAAMRSQLDPDNGAVWKYLEGTGVQPGMGLDNIYSAINAGAPGRFGASDANNGGAPGTVADKVAGMGDHRTKAAQFLGGTWTPSEGGSNITMSARNEPQQDLGALYEALANPFMSESQRAVLTQMIGQAEQQNDPVYQMGLEEQRLKLNALKYPTPETPEPFTLGEGQQRFDGNGNLIAAGAVEPGYTMLTPEEVEADPRLDPTKAWQRSPDGKLEQVGGGGQTINNILNPDGTPADADLRKKLMEAEGTAWAEHLKAGTTASGMKQDMELLDQVIELAPTGPVTGRAAEMFPGVSDAAGVFQSIVKRVAPSLRVEGSGSQSDIEYNGFLQSLPALRNRPEANRAISSFLKAKAQINMDRARVVQMYQNGTTPEGQPFSHDDARKAMAEIDSRSIMTPEVEALLGSLDGGTGLEAPPVVAIPPGFADNPRVADSMKVNGLTAQEIWDNLSPAARAAFGVQP